MFRWLNWRVSWTPTQAIEQLSRGNVPERVTIRGRRPLNLAGSAWLTKLPRDLEAVAVDVSDCRNLITLPARLKCEALDLRRTKVEFLPRGLEVTRLIDATDCRALTRIAPLKVPQLILRGCTALERLPDWLDAQLLDLSRCTRLVEIPSTVAPTVRDLQLSECTRLAELPHGFTNLQTLNVSGCSKLTALPDDMRVCTWVEVAGSGLQGLPWSMRSVRTRWRGFEVSDRVAFSPETITVEEILEEQNLTHRRLLLERVGMEWFVANTNATVVDSDVDAGGERQLLRIMFSGGEDVLCLQVKCPSTGHQYVLRVPPNMTTCAEAAAWMAGYSNPANYRPVVET